jgi:hypothetical protein
MSDHILLSDIQFSAVTKSGFKDVSILTVGEAAGHGVMVDEKTINDFVKLSLGKTIPAYLTHAGAIDSSGRPADRLGKEIGMFSGFYRDGAKIRANFNFLDSFIKGDPKAYETLVEMAQKFSDKLGISPVIAQVRKWVMGDGSEVDATGARPDGAAGLLPIMRVLGIKSCDFVQQPAANIGLFEAKVDAPRISNPPIMTPETVLLSDHTAALEAGKAEVAALAVKHTEAITALEAAHVAAVAALEAKHADALRIAADEKTALAATLAAKTEEAIEAGKYDMRKAGAPALEVALASHLPKLPAPAKNDKGKWDQYVALQAEDAEAAKRFYAVHFSRK